MIFVWKDHPVHVSLIILLQQIFTNTLAWYYQPSISVWMPPSLAFKIVFTGSIHPQPP